MAGHVLGQGLDQVDMAPRDDGLDAFDDGVVVECPADIVLERARGRDHIDIDGETHPLGDALLVGIDTDLDVEHEAVHENAVNDLRCVRLRLRRGFGRGPSQSLFGHDRGSVAARQSLSRIPSITTAERG